MCEDMTGKSWLKLLHFCKGKYIETISYQQLLDPCDIRTSKVMWIGICVTWATSKNVTHISLLQWCYPSNSLYIPPRGVVLHIGVSLHPTPNTNSSCEKQPPPREGRFFMDEVWEFKWANPRYPFKTLILLVNNYTQLYMHTKCAVAMTTP